MALQDYYDLMEEAQGGGMPPNISPGIPTRSGASPLGRNPMPDPNSASVSINAQAPGAPSAQPSGGSSGGRSLLPTAAATLLGGVFGGPVGAVLGAAGGMMAGASAKQKVESQMDEEAALQAQSDLAEKVLFQNGATVDEIRSMTFAQKQQAVKELSAARMRQRMQGGGSPDIKIAGDHAVYMGPDGKPVFTKNPYAEADSEERETITKDVYVPVLDANGKPVIGPDGKPVTKAQTVLFDERTGEPIRELGVPYDKPGTKVEVNTGDEVPGWAESFDKESGTQFAKTLNENAAAAQPAIIRANQGQDLAVRLQDTGIYKNLQVQASRLLGKDVAEEEVFNSLTMEQAMQLVNLTKGSISEKEMMLFMNASPGLGKTPLANYWLFEIQKRNAERAQDAAQRTGEYQEAMKAQGKKASTAGFWKWYNENRDPYRDNPLTANSIRTQFNTAKSLLPGQEPQAEDGGGAPAEETPKPNADPWRIK